jgi:hypothetical protein
VLGLTISCIPKQALIDDGKQGHTKIEQITIIKKICIFMMQTENTYPSRYNGSFTLSAGIHNKGGCDIKHTVPWVNDVGWIRNSKG